MSEDIPGEADLNVFDSLDERTAVSHFLGKTVDEAEALFRENSYLYQEDLMWMGPRGFTYYLPGVVRYLMSPDSAGDDVLVSAMLDILPFQLEQNDLSAARPSILELIDGVLSEYDKFEVDEEVHGNLRRRYEELRQSIVAEP